MEHPKFSVAMCVYGKDNPEWFRAALESVVNQTIPPNEIVLVVDGPVPDELDSVICEYEQLPIFHVVRLAVNQGHGNARRESLRHCSNELVALMDADDLCVPDRFEKQLQMFLKNPDLDIVGGNIAEFIDTPDHIVGRRLVPETDSEIKEYIKTRCPMNQVTVMFNRQSSERVGGYIDWYCEEDYYLWLRMYLAHMRFANVPDILVNVRVGKEMYSRRGGLQYFKSEAKLQNYMRKNKVISLPTWFMNVLKRLIVQVLLPNRIRGWVFQKFARKS